MTKKLKQLGFSIEFNTYLFSVLPIAVFLFRTLPSKLGLHKNSNEQKKYEKEHEDKKGVLANFLDWIWAKELNRIKAKKRIFIGGSTFVVARKK